MKTWYTIALAVCICTPTIQANYYANAYADSDDYSKGIFLGATLMGSFVLITGGISSLCDAHDINHQTAKANQQDTDIASLRKTADRYFRNGINAIALGSALGIAAGIGVCTKVLIPTPQPIKS